MLKYIAVGVVSAGLGAGVLALAGPFDEGPWPVCQYEDGNPDGKECMWVNDGKVWYNDGSEYRN